MLSSRTMRTLIVGDVHGCRIELEALLDRVGFSSGDRLVFVGDLIARGPDSLGVLDVVRRTGAILVRGNHEQKLLDWKAARAARTAPPPLTKVHRDLVHALRPIDWSLLETSLYWLDLPEHDLRVVHAGVIPGVAVEAHDPATLMRIRTVKIRARRAGSGGRETNVLWGSCYVGPPHVVFGHNAAPGLQLHPWATGLDTGCVYGGGLTALVLRDGQKVPRTLNARRQLLVTEPARRVWFAPAAGRSEAESRRRRHAA